MLNGKTISRETFVLDTLNVRETYFARSRLSTQYPVTKKAAARLCLNKCFYVSVHEPQ